MKRKERMESGGIVIESFEENKSGEDCRVYEWYEFEEDDNVPENVVSILREHSYGYEVRQNGKIYKYIGVSHRHMFSEEPAIGSTLIKQSSTDELIKETKPIVDIIRNLAISHKPVKWENLPITGNFRESYNAEKVEHEFAGFKITKLWASTDSYGIKDAKDNSIKLYIITESPRPRGTIQNHYIGKIFVTQNGKKFKKYCEHCENLVFE